jgi:DNA mismatch repair ATPase MutS
VARARAVLDHLETRQDRGEKPTGPDSLFEGLPLFSAAKPVAAPSAPTQEQIDAAAHAKLSALLAGHDPDQMTPRQALDFVYDLAKQLKDPA